MSEQQWHAEIGWQQEAEEIQREREIERANEIAAELTKGRDEELVESLAEKFPTLRAWPGRKDSK